MLPVCTVPCSGFIETSSGFWEPPSTSIFGDAIEIHFDLVSAARYAFSCPLFVKNTCFDMFASLLRLTLMICGSVFMSVRFLLIISFAEVEDSNSPSDAFIVKVCMPASFSCGFNFIDPPPYTSKISESSVKLSASPSESVLPTKKTNSLPTSMA